jgi:hypothetical protein
VFLLDETDLRILTTFLPSGVMDIYLSFVLKTNPLSRLNGVAGTSNFEPSLRTLYLLIETVLLRFYFDSSTV